MECKFVVGQKVVCVNAGTKAFLGETCPKLGIVYTIREVIAFKDSIGLRLVEIVNQPQSYFDRLTEAKSECAFRVQAFAPVHERKTDISALTALLTPAGQKKRIRETEKV